MLTDNIIRSALIHIVNSDPHLVFINVVSDGRNVPVFPDDIVKRFDELVAKVQS